MGRNKAFDPHRFFIFCANVLGSPYGSASPVTTNPATRKPYGPHFPSTTIRDDVRIHKLVLDSLGATSVAVAIEGVYGRNGCPRMASLFTSRIYPTCHITSYVCTTQCMVYLMGRSSTTEYLQRSRVSRRVLYRTASQWVSSCTYECVVNLSKPG